MAALRFRSFWENRSAHLETGLLDKIYACSWVFFCLSFKPFWWSSLVMNNQFPDDAPAHFKILFKFQLKIFASKKTWRRRKVHSWPGDSKQATCDVISSCRMSTCWLLTSLLIVWVKHSMKHFSESPTVINFFLSESSSAWTTKEI